jgi:hypothetical protein
MGILARIINHHKSDADNDYLHDAKCASCKMKPIRHLDRYHCLECPSSPGYDLCGRCFEKRGQTGEHLSGHAMVHFKLPNEFLGISVNNVANEVTLNRLKQLSTLQNEHHGQVRCDGVCHQKRIIGLRFKCDTCLDYDLCETCAIEKHVCTKDHQRDHPLILTSYRSLPKINPNDIHIGKQLGKGGFGKYL